MIKGNKFKGRKAVMVVKTMMMRARLGGNAFHGDDDDCGGSVKQNSSVESKNEV